MSEEPEWIPTLHGHQLEPCGLIGRLVSNRSSPRMTNATQVPWTKKALRDELKKGSAKEEEIYESVVGLWRLQSKAPTAKPYDTIWQNHLEAWLVRREGRYSKDLTFNCGRSRFIIGTSASPSDDNPCRLSKTF